MHIVCWDAKDGNVYGRSQHFGSWGTLESGARYIEEPGYVSAAELCCMCSVLVASAEVAATMFWQMLPQEPAAIRQKGRAPSAPL